MNTAMDVNPSAAISYSLLALVHLATGEVDKARTLLVNNQNIEDPWMYMMRSQVELIDQNYEKGISILESSPYEVMANQWAYRPKPLQFGVIYYVMSEKGLAKLPLQEAKRFVESKLRELAEYSGR